MMTYPIKKLCVFAGSSHGKESVYDVAALKLADLLVKEGITLVYGGGSVGLMHTMANRMQQQGGTVIGIIPDYLVDKEVAFTELDDLRVTSSMHERKQMMMDESDAAIAIPGGLGTLEELFEFATWSQIGLINKPFGVLNTAGFYDKLFSFLDHAVEHEFMSKHDLERFYTAATPEAMLEQLRNHQPQPFKWAKVLERI